MDVPKLLIAARDRTVLTQAQFAAAAGTSRAAVSEYENGRRWPTVATLDRLLAAAGLRLLENRRRWSGSRCDQVSSYLS